MGAKGKPRTPGSGRKSKYSAQLIETICWRLADGESIRAICADARMPAWETVRQWLRAHKEFLQMYAQAREWQQEYWADQIIEIADDDKLDVHRSRLMVDTRKWLMAKLAPRKYGDFKTLDHTGKVEVHVKRITLVDEAAPKKKASLTRGA